MVARMVVRLVAWMDTLMAARSVERYADSMGETMVARMVDLLAVLMDAL